MTMPSIRELERRLSASAPAQKANAVSVKDAVLAIEAQALERISAAEDKQRRAEEEAIGLRKEIDRLQASVGQIRKDAQEKVTAVQDKLAQLQREIMGEAKHEMDEMKDCHKKEMQEMKDKTEAMKVEVKTTRREMDAFKRELASECQARAKAESQVEVLKDMNTQLKSQVAGFKMPAPVIQNNAAPPRSATAMVTKRDGNGRIVSITITPSS